MLELWTGKSTDPLKFKFNRIHVAQIIFEVLVVYEENINEVRVSEIEPRC